jgi:hypothetical protein
MRLIMMTDLSTARCQTPGKTCRTISYNFAVHFAWPCTTALWLALPGSVAAAEKPPSSADVASPLTTPSRISATIEFGLPALASAIERDIPKRLATIDERISCVHRRVLLFRVNPNCDVSGYVERTGPVSLYGRGDHVYGAFPIYGEVSGQGANRFTARIHGDTEARATVEAEARPQLRRGWPLDLNLSDTLHWSEPPVLHVLGRDIALASCAEPRIRSQLARVRSRADAAARRLDLHDRVASAWRQAFEPIKLADAPEIWLQMAPQSAAFAGVRANARVLSGSMAISGTAATTVGQAPPAATPSELPSLGTDVAAPGTFKIMLPVRIGYDVLRDKIDPAAGEWVYLSATPNVDGDKRTLQLSDLAADSSIANNIGALLGSDQLVGQLRDQTSVSYAAAWQNLLNSANQRLTRPLKNGYRMEGRLTSAKLDHVLLSSDGISVAFRASGDLKILYGL